MEIKVEQNALLPRMVPEAEQAKIVLNSGGNIYFVNVEQITHIQACNYYTLVNESGRAILVRQSMQDFERILPRALFIRIHRSVILNINILKQIERIKDTVYIHTTIGKVFRVSRYRSKDLQKRFRTPGKNLFIT